MTTALKIGDRVRQSDRRGHVDQIDDLTPDKRTIGAFFEWQDGGFHPRYRQFTKLGDVVRDDSPRDGGTRG